VETWGADESWKLRLFCRGAVVGATYPEQAQELRALMPHTIFLDTGLWCAQGRNGGGCASVCLTARGYWCRSLMPHAVSFCFRTPAYAAMSYPAGQHALAHAAHDPCTAPGHGEKAQRAQAKMRYNGFYYLSHRALYDAQSQRRISPREIEWPIKRIDGNMTA